MSRLFVQVLCACAPFVKVFPCQTLRYTVYNQVCNTNLSVAINFEDKYITLKGIHTDTAIKYLDR